MAVTTDIGNSTDIHPKNKQDVGKRLAAIALRNVYGKNIVSGGPVFQSMKITGSQAILTFTNTGGGLIAKGNDGKIFGFEIAGEDKVFHPAVAVASGNMVVVTSTSVPHPIAVRYGWTDDAGSDNLFNKEGFPAAPFRTDAWKGVTEGARFEVR
jgi:sialate O-acetylesterase